jgi:hypothetical protein
MFAPVLGDGNQMVRGHGRAIAGMPDGAFIYIFTKGPVAVKYFAVLDSSPTAIEARKSAVHVRCGVRPLVPSAMTVYIYQKRPYRHWKCFAVAGQIEYVTFDGRTTVMMNLRMMGIRSWPHGSNPGRKTRACPSWKERIEWIKRTVSTRGHLRSSFDIGEAVAA